jgi:hypothetical protein
MGRALAIISIVEVHTLQRPRIDYVSGRGALLGPGWACFCAACLYQFLGDMTHAGASPTRRGYDLSW